MTDYDILLATVNAGYIHTAMGLRYIKANLGDIEARSHIVEADSRSSPLQLAELLLALNPKIIAFSVYIWNVSIIADTIKILKSLNPNMFVVLGGPHIVPNDDPAQIQELADVCVSGEGDLIMRDVFTKILSDEKLPKIIVSDPPNLSNIALPYELYSGDDVANRMIYVEASRGCPFSCEYCVSSESKGIRKIPLEKLLPEFEKLLRRGVRQFKFLDRSFNCGGEHSLAVLDFFIERIVPGLKLHLELTPDALSDDLKSRILKFPPGTLHIEMGIQTFNTEVAKRIKRPLNPEQVEKSLRFMIDEAKADVHADLIIGLPGESMESMIFGFDKLVGIAPSEIQIGILKRLPGTKIANHDDEYKIRWNPLPPYDLLENASLNFSQMREWNRISRCWDMLYNRGRFTHTLSLLLGNGDDSSQKVSPFDMVQKITACIYRKTGRMHELSPKNIAESLLEILVAVRGLNESVVKASLERDAREFNWARS